jgi:hypothetical protein
LPDLFLGGNKGLGTFVVCVDLGIDVILRLFEACEEVPLTAEEELLTRLVALNRERAAEEKRGTVRWLRPDYQIPRLEVKTPKPEDEHIGTFDIELPAVTERPKWPTDGLEQIRLVRDLLAKAPAPTPPDVIASVFDGRNTAKRRERIAEVLETLVATGVARTGEHRVLQPSRYEIDVLTSQAWPLGGVCKTHHDWKSLGSNLPKKQYDEMCASYSLQSE